MFFFGGEADCEYLLIFEYKKKYLATEVLKKQGYKDSNLELTESESVALPFGDSPICFVFRLPYRLRRMLLYNSFFSKLQPLFFQFFFHFFLQKFLKSAVKTSLLYAGLRSKKKFYNPLLCVIISRIIKRTETTVYFPPVTISGGIQRRTLCEQITLLCSRTSMSLP